MSTESIVTKQLNPNKRFSITARLMADENLSSTAKLVMMALQDHRNKKTGQCNPRREILAREVGVSLPTITRALAELRVANFIVAKKLRYTNCYQFQTDQIRNSERSDCSNPQGRTDQIDQSGTSVSLYEPIESELKAAAYSEVEIDPAAAAGKEKTKTPTQKPPARATDESGFRLVKQNLNALAPLVGLPMPDDDLVWRVIDAANGANGEEIAEALVHLWKRDALRNMRSWGFIPLKIADLARKAATA